MLFSCLSLVWQAIFYLHVWLFQLHAAFTSSEQKQYASAGAVAEEVLSSVRTVVAFGGEHNEVERYKSHLRSVTRVGIKKGVTLGGSLGLQMFTLFVTFAVAFW